MKWFYTAIIFFLPSILPGIVASVGSLPLLKTLDYTSAEIQTLRNEVKDNLFRSRHEETISVTFKKYVVKNKDTFFSIMAKTMLDHDTLSSVNMLASLWDVNPGTTWLIPNARGIAVEGNREELARKYNIDSRYIFPIPGQDQYYFIVDRSFDSTEREFLNGTIFIKPVLGKISSRYGVRLDPFTNKHKFHKGIDIACPIGSPVFASAKGKVVFAGQMGGYGNLVIIEHKNGYQTLYGHLKSIEVRVQQNIEQGERIALSGNTGNVTGPHLHFEVKRKGKNILPKIKSH